MKFPNVVQRLIILLGVLAIILMVFYPVEEIILRYDTLWHHLTLREWETARSAIDAPDIFVRMVAIILVVIGLVLVASNKKH